MSYLMRSRPGSYSRQCDVCGRPRPIEAFRQVGNLFICSFHPGYVPAFVLDKVPIVEVGRPVPIKNAKPFAPVDTFEASEAEVFKLIVDYAPVGIFDVTNANAPVPGLVSNDADMSLTVDAAAASVLYLYDLLAENKRPAIWLATARAKIVALGDWLLEQQIAGPQNASDDTATQWGAFSNGTSVTSDVAGWAGLALLRCYQQTGADKYLAAARASAWFIRTLQCADKRVSSPDTVHRGMWTTTAGGNVYRMSSLSGLEFLVAFKDEVGDETIGSSSTTADYSASRAALLSTCIAEARTFWLEGQGGVTGLSTTTPSVLFNMATGWTASGNADGLEWAVAIRAFYMADGATAHVTGLFDWLMTFASDATFETPATSDVPLVANATMGTFDPKVCLTQTINTSTKKNTDSYYDLATAGLLAPLYAARQAANFKALKQAIGTPRPMHINGTDADGRRLYINRLGICGLSFQPGSVPFVDLARAARAGNVYRCAPQAFMGQGRAPAVNASDVTVVDGVAAAAAAAVPHVVTLEVVDDNRASGSPIASVSTLATQFTAGVPMLLTVAMKGGIQPSISGGGVAWTLVASSVDGTGAATNLALYVFKCVPAVTASVTTTITFNDSNTTGTSYSLNSLTGATGMIPQASNATSPSATSALVTLGAFASVYNATFGIVFKAVSGGINEGAGFASLYTDNAGATGRVLSEARDDNDQTVDFSWTGACAYVACALEIEAA